MNRIVYDRLFVYNIIMMLVYYFCEYEIVLKYLNRYKLIFFNVFIEFWFCIDFMLLCFKILNYWVGFFEDMLLCIDLCI